MQFCYSPTTKLFYQRDFNPNIPEDAVDTTNELMLKCAGLETAAGPDGQPRVIGEKAVAFLEDLIANKRWQVETGGITLPNGIRLDTTRADQSAIADTLSVWPFTALETISFKAASGFVVLNQETLQSLAGVIGVFKQACYEAERLHCLRIAELDADALLAYDVDANWPSNVISPPEEPPTEETPPEEPPPSDDPQPEETETPPEEVPPVVDDEAGT